jgi:hypothetical protein
MSLNDSVTKIRLEGKTKRRGQRHSTLMTGEAGAPSDRNSRRIPHGEIFVAGSTVRESGIYEVLHDVEHRAIHEVVMISDDLFPPCDTCEYRVKYRVVRTAPYIFSDEDFEEPKR